jgi:hypothetical protein
MEQQDENKRAGHSLKLSVQHVDNLRFLITAGEHTGLADAAPEDGGGGTAMSAPTLFVAAIGACVLEFVTNSCRLRDIPIEHLSLEMTYELAPGPRRVAGLKALLHLEPEPPDDVKRRLIGVARHATLVNSLAHPAEIEIRFTDT